MNYSGKTYTYKVVKDCPIQADVYQPPGDEQRPAVLWIHGGALIIGSRSWLPSEQVELYLKAGYTVVSIDYRLAPETKLPAILEDVQDPYHWVITQGPELFNINPDRIAVIGNSGGGYLTLMTGLIVHPRPKALVSFYGYGDIVGDWYSRPDTHYNEEPAVSMEEARKVVGGTVITAGEFNPRWQFYIFCRQQGLWLKEVTGYDPHTEPEAFESLCPVRHVTQDYPPTLLLHGDKDMDIPCELSKQMAAALNEHHVPHQLIMMNGMGHLFDIFPDGFMVGEPIGLKHPRVTEAFEVVLSFLNEQLGG